MVLLNSDPVGTRPHQELCGLSDAPPWDDKQAPGPQADHGAGLAASRGLCFTPRAPALTNSRDKSAKLPHCAILQGSFTWLVVQHFRLFTEKAFLRVLRGNGTLLL